MKLVRLKIIVLMIFLVGVSVTFADEGQDSIEEKLISQHELDSLPLLQKIIQDFIQFRIVSTDRERAREKITIKQRALQYSIFIENLQNYQLVPRKEKECLYSLLPNDQKEYSNKTNFDANDFCYPKYGEPLYHIPSAWEVEDETAIGDNLDNSKAAGPNNSNNNEINRGGGTRGGIGRGGGRSGR